MKTYDIKEKDLIFMQKYKAFKEFLFRINFSNELLINVPSPKNIIYKFYVAPGNNSILVKNILKQRWWWSPAESKDAENINFLWTQWRQNDFISSLKTHSEFMAQSNQITNNNPNQESDNEKTSQQNEQQQQQQQQQQGEITEYYNTDSENETSFRQEKQKKKTQKQQQIPNKLKIIENFTNKFDFQNQEIINSDKHLLLFSQNELQIVQQYLQSLKKQKKDDIYDSNIHQSNQITKYFWRQDDTLNWKMCNHLESNYHLSNKKALFINVKLYYEALGQDPFKYIPLTFHIQNGTEDPQFKKFVEFFNENAKCDEDEKKSNDKKKKNKQIWIIKPGENSNRGCGINVCENLEDIQGIVNGGSQHKNGKKKTFIIQKYIDKPFLYQKRKFDIRCYMLMTSVNGILKAYWYQDGYIRTSCKEFTLKNISNRMIHLTNDAVQKKCDEYGKYENGNKLSYAEFQKYLDAQHAERSLDFMKQAYPQMKQLAQASVKSVYSKIDPKQRHQTFEVFGLDFLIDEDFNVWLIEINTNPCLELSSSHLAKVIPAMLENAFRIALDPIFPPPIWASSKRQMVSDNILENNKFELIFDERQDGPALKALLYTENAKADQIILDQISETEEEYREENSAEEDNQ